MNVIIDPLNTFVLDRHFQVPWIDGAPKLTTHDGDPACSTQSGGACAAYTLTVSTANVWFAMYDHTSNQFHSWSSPQDYSAFFSATSAAGAPDCNPSSVEEFFGGFGGSTEIVPNSQPHFQGCTP